MGLGKWVRDLEKATRKNSSSVFAGLGIAGVVATGYLAVRATFKAAEAIQEDEMTGGVSDDPKRRLKERAELVWPLYIPPVVSAGATVCCILASTRAGHRKAAAAATAYSLSERAFAEYRGKVVEQLGERKEQGVRDAVAQDSVRRNPPDDRAIIVTGSGDVLCCELHTGRYFKSDMETLRRSQNDINAQIMHEYYVTLDEFYSLIGIPGTDNSGAIGWTSDRLMELEFSTAMSESGDPCLTFRYNYVKPI